MDGMGDMGVETFGAEDKPLSPWERIDDSTGVRVDDKGVETFGGEDGTPNPWDQGHAMEEVDDQVSSSFPLPHKLWYRRPADHAGQLLASGTRISALWWPASPGCYITHDRGCPPGARCAWHGQTGQQAVCIHVKPGGDCGGDERYRMANCGKRFNWGLGSAKTAAMWAIGL